MENRTDMVGISWSERLRQVLHSNRGWLIHGGTFLSGLVLSNSWIMGGISPFGVAFSAAVGDTYAFSAALGAVAGYLLSSTTLSNVKYIVAVLLVAISRWMFGPKAPAKFRMVTSAAICVLSLIVANAAMLISTDATLYDVVVSLAELLLACGATYFFARCLAAIESGWQGLGRLDISCIIITAAVLLMGLSSLYIGRMSVGRIIAVLIVLLCARYGEEAGGAIAGITAGTALGLVTGNYAYVAVAYALGGLVAGIFSSMGRIATAASFIFVNTITALFIMEYADVYNAIFEVFASTVLFILIPQSLILRLGIHNAVRPVSKDTDISTQTALHERLQDLSMALEEISATTQEVSKKLGAMEGDSLSKVYTKVAEQVCAYCGYRTTCWQYRYSETVEAMNDAILLLKKDGTLTKERMPKHFHTVCCKEEEFVAALNTRFLDYVAKEGVQRQVSKVRGVVTDQFEGMSLMLGEVADDLGNMRLLDASKGKAVKDYMEKQGIQVKHILCYTDEFERLTVEMQMPGYHVARLHKTKSALELGELLEVDFDLPQITQREKYALVHFSEKAEFTIEAGVFQLAAKGSRLCGDAYDIINNKKGQSHLLISDGMGSGGNAAVDSAMASGLISRLLSVGIGHDAALKIVNSALLIKSGEESLATIDICTLDLFTGRAQFYKAGAAPTYVVKNGKAGYVESTSLPVGILRGVAFEQSGLSLHEGDWVVMVSDGVTATGCDWVLSELESALVQKKDVQKVCEQLANTAKMRRTDGREDDITVLAAVMAKGA